MNRNFKVLDQKIDQLLNHHDQNALTIELIDTRFKHYMEKVSKLFEAELAVDSLIVLNIAIKELPMCTEFLYFKAFCLMQENDFVEARKQFEDFTNRGTNVDLVEKAKGFLERI